MPGPEAGARLRASAPVPRRRSSSWVVLPAGSAAERAGSGGRPGAGGRGREGRATRALLRRRRCRRGFGVSCGRNGQWELERGGGSEMGEEEEEVVGAGQGSRADTTTEREETKTISLPFSSSLLVLSALCVVMVPFSSRAPVSFPRDFVAPLPVCNANYARRSNLQSV